MSSPILPASQAGRRTFIKSAAAAGVVLAGWKPTLGRGRALQKLNVASIGVGGMGTTDLAQIASHPEVAIVGLCDTDSNNLGGAKKLHPGARTFADGREMFESLGDGVDAVSITTPDHMHAIYAMTAMNNGKHVYCQKPLAWSVHENRALAAAAAANPKLATQMGTQNASRPMKQRCMKFVRDGNLGKIKEVHAWSDRPIWPQGNPRPAGSDPVPASLSWDLWLGVAPERPYKNNAYHAFAWRGVRDFGCGALGDMACHIVDAAFQPLDLGDPTSVICEASDGTEDQFPSKEVVKMKLAGNSHSDGEPIPFTWYDGKILPQPSSMGLPADFSLPQNVVVVVGEKGTIMVPQGGDGYAYFRKGKQRPMEMPEARGGSHWHLWVDRARGGDRPCLTPIEYGGRVSETLAIGVIASQFPNQPLEWDAKSMSFPASPEATAYVTRKYRPGWQAKGLG
jgi:predicted dehydrogenase